ncbi:MAG: TrmH family RNA methyltransferase [Micromonosporaceae bacterium]
MAGPELTNPRAGRVKAARRLAKRAFRVSDGLFLAEGPQAVREAVATPGRVRELFVAAEAARRHPEIAETAQRSGAEVYPVSGEVMAALTQTVTPQGLVAVCTALDVPLEQVTAARPALVAVLAHVRDPGNAGTVLRAADAAGAEAVVFSSASVDPYNPKCVRASAGSLFHLPVVTGVPTEQSVAALRAAGSTVLAADRTGGVDLDEAGDRGLLGQASAWLFGNEAWGLPEPTLADEVVRVPIHGRAESLNLAGAATVCLYASARAQRAPGGCRSQAARR